MKYKLFLVAFILCTLVFINFFSAKANGLANLIKYSQNSGTMTNVNKGKVSSDQQAGYLTGGSIISRGPKPKNLKILNIQPPSFTFDPCTGSYDARFGGLSFISGRAFADFLKTIPSSTGAYALKMLIKEVCPQCEDITSYLETVARDINSFTLNQCNFSKSIARGGLGMLNSSLNQHCIMNSNILSANSDLFAANESCNDDPYRFEEEKAGKELETLLGQNFNLVWKALSQNADGIKTNIKELMMSISGSIICRTEDKNLNFTSLPSLVDKDDLLEKYMGRPEGEGTEITIYSCDEPKQCLFPYEVKQKLTSNDTIYGNVSRLLQSVADKVFNNEGELSEDERVLIEFSTIPLINIIEMELAIKSKSNAASLVGMHEFIEVVCYDMIINYMHKMLMQTKASVELLKTVQLDSMIIDKFIHSSDLISNYLRDKRFEAFKKLQIIMQVKEKFQQQQKVFELEFSRFMNSIGK